MENESPNVVQPPTAPSVQPEIANNQPSLVEPPLEPTINLRSRKSKDYIFLTSAFIFGLIFIFAGFRVYNSSLIPSYYTKTTGTVKSVTSRIVQGKGGSSTEYFPIISFKASNNQYYVFQGSVGKISASNYSIGQVINIAYNPQSPNISPKENVADAKAGIFIGPTFIAVGFVVIVVGLIVLFRLFSSH